MIIGIDISPVLYGTGVSVYTKRLVEHLLKIDNENEYLLFGGSLRRKPELYSFVEGLKGNYKSKIISFPPTLSDYLWNKMHVFRIEKITGRLDLFHSSDWAEPPSNAVKVTTVHDLTPFKFPEIMDPKLVRAHKLRLRWVKKETRCLIVPSYSTKSDLLEMGFNEERIVVIPEGVDNIKKSTHDEIEKLKKKKGIFKNYYLDVGVGYRKNTDKLIQAFNNLSNNEFELVLVGINRTNNKTTGNVKFLGHVTDAELNVLFSGASALAYPSLYEGFGLPILQAFQAGCPVVTSNTSSMPEVAGNAAILVDPYSVESITKGLEKVLSDRDNLVSLGKQRVKEFTWEKMAKSTLEVYKFLLN